MRQKRAALALALVLALNLVPTALAASAGTAKASTQSVEVDGTPVEFQMYALMDENGGQTNYVKLRDVAHVLNSTPAKFSVGYDGTINIVTGEAYTDNGSEMTTPFSGDRAYEPGPGAVKVNGADVNLDAIVLKDDNGGAYTYFKLRDLGTALGFKVDWTSERGVLIETGAQGAEGQITLADLEGTWHMALTAKGQKPISNSDIEISGSQYHEYSVEGSTCILRSGTITAFEVDTAGRWPYTIAWSGTYQSTYNQTFNSSETQEKLLISEINLTEGYFIDQVGLRYERVASSGVKDQVMREINAAKEAEKQIEEARSKYATYPGLPVPDFGAVYGISAVPKGWYYGGTTPEYSGEIQDILDMADQLTSGMTTYLYKASDVQKKVGSAYPVCMGTDVFGVFNDYIKVLEECGFKRVEHATYGGNQTFYDGYGYSVSFDVTCYDLGLSYSSSHDHDEVVIYIQPTK